MRRTRTTFWTLLRRLSVGALFAIAITTSVLAAETSEGEPDGAQLEDIEKALEQQLKQSEGLNRKSDVLAQELGQLRRKLINTARTIQNHERAIIAFEADLVELERSEHNKAARLSEQRAQFAEVLMALERLARFPPEAMIAQPTKPADTVRSAILLRSVVPEIEQRAARLRRDVDALVMAREQLNEQRFALKNESAMLDAESIRLGSLLARKKDLKQETDAQRAQAAERAKKLALEAETLRDLMVKLEEDRRERELASAVALEAAPPKPAPNIEESQVTALLPSENGSGILTSLPISEQRGRLPYPVVGKVQARYGEVNENGMSQRGIEIATRVGAQVIAPYEGQVAFVGDFRGYGQLLIIEHAEGYHTLLAGMARIDSVMGNTVLAGEPVGVMDGTAAAQPVLYVELRRNGRPINPLPWLASRNGNTQG